MGTNGVAGTLCGGSMMQQSKNVIIVMVISFTNNTEATNKSQPVFAGGIHRGFGSVSLMWRISLPGARTMAAKKAMPSRGLGIPMPWYLPLSSTSTVGNRAFGMGSTIACPGPPVGSWNSLPTDQCWLRRFHECQQKWPVHLDPISLGWDHKSCRTERRGSGRGPTGRDWCFESCESGLGGTVGAGRRQPVTARGGI